MSRAVRLTLVGLMALVVVCLGRRVLAGPPARPETITCRPAVLVDGHLLCGSAVNAVLARLCGGGVADADPVEPRTGDVVSLADGCRVVGRLPGPELLALGVSIDLNSASALELEALPGIGPTLARRIVEARPLRRIDDLLRVRGIGKTRLAAVRPHVHADLSRSPAASH